MDKQTFIEKYYTDRFNTRSLKWDLVGKRFKDENLLPLWVADMDFKVSDAITQTLQERVEHGIYGYSFTDEAYFDTFNNWMTDHFNFSLEKDWIRYTTGIVQALNHFIHAFTKADDAILILTPVYYPFHDAVTDTGRKLVTLGLENEACQFDIDFEAFEEAIITDQVKMYIHCSPHNPAGRVWLEEEQQRLFEICEKYDVLIISDEIHQDFTFGGAKHIPSAMVANGRFRNRIVTANAASKSFNLAALTHAHIIIPDENLRKIYDDYANTVIKTELNIMGVLATEAAYKGGQAWLDTVKSIIEENYDCALNKLKKELPEVTVAPLQGTYLMFMDLNPILKGMSSREFMQKKCGVAIDYGEWFGSQYEGYIRINLATKFELVNQAIASIIREAKLLKN
ncbi:MalY/PatB family protein [Jeotgalibaca sp. A122]|uniref:MalY/PatB family protein n=1 Tax=Jeotgalibaca sp. A122 TaxID=3457322 RepID=UPI003FD6BD8C